jgi:hypothetical protein
VPVVYSKARKEKGHAQVAFVFNMGRAGLKLEL